MKQLVQLQKHAGDFKKLNTELVFVFREERGGAKALKGIKKRAKTEFSLVIDLNKKTSSVYSNKKRLTFDNFVIDHAGVVRKIIPGTLRDRATSEELTKALKEIEAKRKK